MATSDDYLVIFHASDAEQWANFLSARLNGPKYNIRSELKNMQRIAEAISSKSSTKSGKSTFDPRDSGRGSRIAISDLTNVIEDTESAKARVVLLSPDVLSMEPFPFDVTRLNPKRSVFLFLGVEIEDVRTYFGAKEDSVFKCRLSIIHSDEKSVQEAMVQIIEAYEESDLPGSDVEDDIYIYQTPVSSRQLNKVEKSFPRDLTEKEREVYILLQRQAEEDLTVFLNGFNQEIPLNQVEGRLYTFTLPDEVKGEVSFQVKCKDYVIGQDTVHAFTRLDRIKALLNEEVNPMSVLASAVGLPPHDLDGLDQALALRLRQLSSVSTFRKMFPCEDALNNSVTDERGDVLYPSLLHFAADHNLQKFSAVLLTYPGMLTAALTENKDGDYPSTMASKKGYTELESDLIQFVQDQKVENVELRNIAECDLYVKPSPIVDTPLPAPKPHFSANTPGYVNDQPPTDDYCLDTRKASSGAQSQNEDLELLSPSSGSSDVFTHYPHSEDDEDELSHHSQPPISKKALKMLGTTAEHIQESGMLTPSRSRSSSQNTPYTTLPKNITRGVKYPGFSLMPSEMDRISVSSNCDDPELYRAYTHDTRQKTTKKKITEFLGKIRSKRSPSEGEINYVPKGMKKTPSTRSDKTAKSTFWLESKTKKKSTDANDQERDSGSYSDNENDTRKNKRPKEFKERGIQMTRRKSKRVVLASQDQVSDAPKLPSTKRREGFTSYIENV